MNKLNILFKTGISIFLLTTTLSCDAFSHAQSSSQTQNTQSKTSNDRENQINYPPNSDRIPTTATLPGKLINYEKNPYGTRYKNYIFDNYKITTETYIKNAPDFNGKPKNLIMDIFSPQNDDNTNRACIIYLYGGGFSMKVDDGMSEICKSMALRGYVVAAIDYRIGFVNDDNATNCTADISNDFSKAELRATQDAIAAIKYIKTHASRLGINPNKIFIGGQSAGAIAALNSVYYDNFETAGTLINQVGGTLDASCSADIKNQTTRVAGIFALSGAITNSKIIDNANKIPTLLVNGTCDEFIYQQSGAIYKCDIRATNPNLVFPTAYGPDYMYNTLISKNNPTFYIKVCNGGHANNNWGYQKVVDWVASFTYAVINNTFKSGTAIVYPDKGVCNLNDCNK